MKIDHQPLLVINKPVGWASAQQWSLHLDSVGPRPNLPDTRHADEYYWQHQQQLQHSDLTFNPVARESTPPITPDGEPVTEPINPSTTEIDITPLLSYMSMLAQTDAPEMDGFAVVPAQAGIHFDCGSEPVSGFNSRFRMDSRMKIINTIALKPLQAPPSTSMLKQYQLFVDDNQVELTLNTAHLSKQQIIELQAFIHQWLSQKGYTLKQLILNGEHQ